MEVVSLLFICFIIYADAEVQAEPEQQQLCRESRCGAHGPVVRFPFRLVDRQPERCGYPGFELSCTEDNHTLLALADSIKLLVEDINYADQFVRVQPQDCFARKAQSLNFTSSVFDSSYTHTFFNCSSDVQSGHSIACLSSPGNYVITKSSSSLYDFYDDNLLSCTKMYDVPSLPYDIFDPRPVLSWITPDCQRCEDRSQICGPSSTGNQSTSVQCFTRPHPHTKKGIVAVAAAGVCALLLLITMASIYYVKTSSVSKNDVEIEKFLKDYTGLMPTRYTYSDIKRFTSNFKDKLGQGGYGSVYRGKVSGDTIVAVKILHNSTGIGHDFVNEVATMGKIHHVNVVRLVGFCADGVYRALVFEFLPNGSLNKYISLCDSQEQPELLLNWSRLYNIAAGISKGIEYLHQGCDQRILHFDIKPNNILLDKNFTPKLCDFGQAKLCAKGQSVVSMHTARGTMGYIAPEVYSRNFGSVSSKSDVYSFGMLLLEMVGGRRSKPAAVSAGVSQTTYVPEMIYNCLKHGGDLAVKVEDEAEYKIVKKLANVGLWCIQWLPEDRPSMKVVIQMLEADGDWLRMPADPFASINRMKGVSSSQATTKFRGGDLEVIEEAG
uniref:Protein kinase domain-containing protein n=1 Tax=Kalanchoe fedtschenkoi TaxID=63787 RepID=A0A7N0REN9_KALFE